MKKLNLLTPNQLEIARLIAKGLDHTQIKKRLKIANSTFNGHVVNIHEKLGTTNKVQIALVVLAEEKEAACENWHECPRWEKEGQAVS